ncbi:hypothetical protein W01_10480 [Candidatus Nitrotoga sp. AM1P]|nr:hypothetical protein W01_10480 [Candidatus Nitrotoga sp. AM1P]
MCKTQFSGALFDSSFKAGIQLAQFLVLPLGQGLETSLVTLQLLVFERMTHDQAHVLIVPRLGNVAENLALIDRLNG